MRMYTTALYFVNDLFITRQPLLLSAAVGYRDKAQPPGLDKHSACRAPVAVRICEPQCITSLSGCFRVQFRMSTAPIVIFDYL